MYNYSNYGAGNQYQYNPYYTIPQQPKVQPNEPYINQQPQMQPTYKQSMLQGKSVDSLDVVKAMDIPLDGSISYFPLTDGTAIVTKQLQVDGTSKTVVYKPAEEKNVDNVTAFITSKELEDRLTKIKPIDYKEDIKKINRQIEDLIDEIDKINKGIKKRKDD